MREAGKPVSHAMWHRLRPAASEMEVVAHERTCRPNSLAPRCACGHEVLPAWLASHCRTGSSLRRASLGPRMALSHDSASQCGSTNNSRA